MILSNAVMSPMITAMFLVTNVLSLTYLERPSIEPTPALGTSYMSRLRDIDQQEITNSIRHLHHKMTSKTETSISPVRVDMRDPV
jgi:hypothetical protein